MKPLKNQEVSEKITTEVKDYCRRKAQNGPAKKLQKKTHTFTIIASHLRAIKNSNVEKSKEKK